MFLATYADIATLRRATVKEESHSHRHHEEVRDETVLANTAEPDPHFNGFLDLHTDTPDMALR